MIVYSRVTLINGTIYSQHKGNKINRRGDTLVISSDAFSRVVHVPWSAVVEADFVEQVKEHTEKPLDSVDPSAACNGLTSKGQSCVLRYPHRGVCIGQSDLP